LLGLFDVSYAVQDCI